MKPLILFVCSLGSLVIACAQTPARQDFSTLALHIHDLPQDSMVHVSAEDFDALVAHLSGRLRSDPLEKWAEQDHINLMRTLNTFMFERRPGERFHGERYAKLDSLADSTEYVKRLPDLFPQWIPNRGMGYYFVQLDMELYGTPSLRGRFNISHSITQN